MQRNGFIKIFECNKMLNIVKLEDLNDIIDKRAYSRAAVNPLVSRLVQYKINLLHDFGSCGSLLTDINAGIDGFGNFNAVEVEILYGSILISGNGIDGT